MNNIKNRISLALDLPTVEQAISLAEKLYPYIGIFKIGKELHCQALNQKINIIEKIYQVSNGQSGSFLDLKLHDTPNTVFKAGLALTVPGVYIYNVHVSGGEAMCREAVRAAQEQSAKLNISRPKVIGVTVLTSLSDEDLKKEGINIGYRDLTKRRTELAKEWGLDGVVCSALEAPLLEKEFGSDFLYVTPGISWGGKAGSGQKQIVNADQAARDCQSSILVIGRAITEASDPVKTAQEIYQNLTQIS